MRTKGKDEIKTISTNRKKNTELKKKMKENQSKECCSEYVDCKISHAFSRVA